MKKLTTILMLTLLLCSGAAIGQEKPWFDMEKCAFCKTISAEKGLMDHMTTEYHNISNGTVSVTYIDADFKEAFSRAQTNMGKVVEEMKTGTMPVMCQHCETMGTLFQAGCKQEGVQSRDCIIMVYTGTDSAMVAKIHDFGTKSADALAKMKTAK